MEDGQIVEIDLPWLISLTELAEPLCSRDDDWITVDPALCAGIGSMVEDLAVQALLHSVAEGHLVVCLVID